MCVSHANVIHFIPTFIETFGIDKNDIIANQAPLDFDVSIKDLYTSFYTGATCILIPKTYFSNPKKLMDYLCSYSVTALTWAVSALCILTTYRVFDVYNLPNLRQIMFS